MDEQQLRAWIAGVTSGRLSRRRFIRMAAGVGIAAPLATQLLRFRAAAMAQPPAAYKPTKRGGGGALKVLWWQGPTLLNPHFAVGTKDQEGSRIFYEPLAGWDADGNLVPMLAAEVPSARERRRWRRRQVGHLEAEARRAVARRPAVHRGRRACSTGSTPRDPATARDHDRQLQGHQGREGRQPHGARSCSPKPTPFWADPFVGTVGMIIPKHLFEGYQGREVARGAGQPEAGRHRPVQVRRLQAGRHGARRSSTRITTWPNRPYFDTIEMKGGGDAVSAARAVLQTGEYDYAWNLQVEDEILKRLEAGGKGRERHHRGRRTSSTSQLNFTDPCEGGRRRALEPQDHAPDAHRSRGAPGARHCWSTAGRSRNTSTAAPASRPRTSSTTRSASARKNTKFEFNVDKANALLEQAGWKTGADGIRAKDGKKLRFVFQTSINQPRQKTQAIVKQACQKAGIEIELKAVTASVFFSSDVANPDTYTKFYADLQMYTTTMPQPDPERFMNQFCPGRRDQGQQVAGPQHHALAKRRIFASLAHTIRTEIEPVFTSLFRLACGEQRDIEA